MFGIIEYFTKNDIGSLNSWNVNIPLKVVNLIQKISPTNDNFIYNQFEDGSQSIVERAQEREISIWFGEAFTLSIENLMENNTELDKNNIIFSQIEFIRKIEHKFDKIYLFGCDYNFNHNLNSNVMVYNTFDIWLLFVLFLIQQNYTKISFHQSEFNMVSCNKVIRPHRQMLAAYLKNIDECFLTFIGDKFTDKNIDSFILDNEFLLNNMNTILKTNLNFDDARVGFNEDEKFFKIIQKGLLAIITESRFFYPNANISEKVLYSLLSKRIILPVSSYKSVSYIDKLGFKLNTGINYSYDNISNDFYRLYQIYTEIDRLNNLDMDELYESNRNIIEYNHNILYTNEIINNMLKIGNLS